MGAIIDGWEVGAPVIVGLLLIGLIIFSILRPSGRVRIGLFFEREHFHDEEEPSDEADTKEWPVRKD